MTSQLSSDIASVRVTTSNPATSRSEGKEWNYKGKDRDHVDSPRSDYDMDCSTPNAAGMDSSRCAAFHNAIVRHGWVSRGHELSDLPQRTYWERWRPTLTPYQSELLRDRLHPSVLAFLQQAIELPDFYPGSFKPPNFFYHLVGLNAPLELFSNHEEAEGDRYVTLYSLQSGLVAEGRLPDGLVYDQLQHKCVLIRDIEEGPTLDLDERELVWRPLETVLTEYCEMIETGKVVALSKSVKGPEPFEYVRNPAGGYAMREIPDEELRDPRTGARRTKKCFDPWVMVPFTERDVELAAEAWNRLVKTIEARIPALESTGPDFDRSVYSLKVLERAGMRRNGFAFRFLSRAIKPSFTYLGPDLRLLSDEEFVHQPFQDVTLKRECSVPPIFLLKSCNIPNTLNGDDRPETRDKGPSGIYLERCDPDAAFPFENTVKVVFDKAGDWETTRRVLRSHESTPFSNGVLLHTVLGLFAKAVDSGEWSVGPDGVKNDILMCGT